MSVCDSGSDDVMDITRANEKVMFCGMMFAGVVRSVFGAFCP